LPDDDTAADMQDWIHTRTATAGYGHYEVSAYAQPHQHCRHNLNYWHFGDYLGIGAGAHAKLSFPDRIVRQMRYPSPAAFIEHARAGNAVSEQHDIRAADLPFEFMLNALRLVDGFAAHEFALRTGLPLTAIEAPLREAQRRGLIARDHLKITPTVHGQRFLNDLQMLFLAE
jgi:oxygen-independent coproporphyrinogen-3 oxidase